MGREHWIKGMNKFLWNISVLIHDFVGGYSSNTKYRNLMSLQTVGWKLSENAENLRFQTCCFVPRMQVLVLHCILEWREGVVVAVIVWMSSPVVGWCRISRQSENDHLVFVSSAVISFYKWFYLEQAPKQIVRVNPFPLSINFAAVMVWLASMDLFVLMHCLRFK